MQWLRVTVVVRQTLNWIPLCSVPVGTMTVGECLRILEPHQFLHLNNSDNKINFPAGLLGEWDTIISWITQVWIVCTLYIVLYICITLSFWFLCNQIDILFPYSFSNLGHIFPHHHITKIYPCFFCYLYGLIFLHLNF